MASVNKPKVPNKIPETRIVGPSRFRTPAQTPAGEDLFVRGNPYVSATGTEVNEDGTLEILGIKKIGEIQVPEIIDVPDLSDIEKITFEEYKNNEGVTKIKVFIKVRNSSKNKNNIAGVDARILPKGA